MNALSLFTGIGGADIAAEAAGIRIVAMSEINPLVTERVPNRAAHIKALGNAIVPAQIYPIFEAIMEVER